VLAAAFFFGFAEALARRSARFVVLVVRARPDVVVLVAIWVFLSTLRECGFRIRQLATRSRWRLGLFGV
jgi:hypothetical protein